MIRGRLTLALDGKGIGPAQRTRTAARNGTQWYVYDGGPGFIKSYAVDEFDEQGLAWLEAHEERPAEPGKQG